MWPKVLAQLFELLPHAARLVPMADKYFSSRTNAERATETALVAMADDLRGDLGQVAKAHAGLSKQLQEQSAQIAEVTEDVRQIKESLGRAMVLASRAAALGRWVKFGVSLIVVLLIALIVLLVRGR